MQNRDIAPPVPIDERVAADLWLRKEATEDNKPDGLYLFPSQGQKGYVQQP